jgi:hypothetical protein
MADSSGGLEVSGLSGADQGIHPVHPMSRVVVGGQDGQLMAAMWSR